jgi:hypothetical protein
VLEDQQDLAGTQFWSRYSGSIVHNYQVQVLTTITSAGGKEVVKCKIHKLVLLEGSGGGGGD